MADLLEFEISGPDDAVTSAAAAHGMASKLGLSSLNRMRFFSSALEAGARLLPGGGKLTVRQGSEGMVELAANGKTIVAFPLSKDAEPRELGASAAEVELLGRDVNELTRSRGMVATLEAELEETNRGVMALYAELDERAEKLRQADDLKSRFLSYASHELRTPLNGIIGLVRLLKFREQPRDPEELKQLGFIHQAAESMREMVNDLLDLAKVEAGKVTIQPTEFGLDLVFGALRGIFRPLLQSDDVVLAFDDTSAVPAIYSDEAKVSQILRNFISNAIKFTEHGEVRVWAVAEGELIHISVSDTGIGIPPDHLSLIFDEFTQVDSPIQRRVQGTGLGLPLCRKLAELLGGRVTVSSEVGKGSVFTLILPREYRAAGVEAMRRDTGIQRRPRPTVLIVDDEEIDRYLVTKLVSSSGDYTILQSEDGQAGLEAARRERPDMIFLDLNLPRIDGYRVLTELRADPVTELIPVVVVTSAKLTEADYQRLRPLTQGIMLKEQLSEVTRLAINLSPPVSVTLT